jgi:hypothetical protein
MSGALVGGLLAALASAAALNWGYFAQHGAASALPPLSLRRPLRSLATLFRNRRWFVGFLFGIGGWVLYVGALALAPLSLVQASSAGGVAVLALLAGRLARAEKVAVAVAVGGLVLLGISLAGSSPSTSHGHWTSAAIWMAASVAAALAFVALPLRRLAGGAPYGIAAGVLYAAGDVGTKAAVSGGARLAFVPALLACHGLAFVALQLGFQRGRVLATAGMATLWTNALPIAAGTILFDERIPAGARGLARIVAFVAVVIAAALLMRGERSEAAVAPPPPRRRLRWATLLTLLLLVAAAAGTAATAARSDAAPLRGFNLLARAPAGGTVWTGRIPNPYAPWDTRLSDVYLPPGYTPTERYPVLYLLHGFWGSPSSFVASFRIGTAADGAISAHAARPFIVVMPPGGPIGKNANGEWAGIWEDYVVNTVVPWADRHLSTLQAPQARAIGGLSSGAFGAVDIALRHLGTFGVAESWDGYFRPFRDGPFAHASPAQLARHDPALLVRREAPGVRRVRLRFFLSTGGGHGPVARRWTFEFARELTALRITHRLWTLPHGQKHFGRAQLPAALTYAEPPA